MSNVFPDNLPRMCWTLIGTSVLSSLIGLSDMYYAGTISETAQAAVGISEQFLFLAIILGTGLAVGATACISSSVGAGRLNAAWAYTKDALVLTVLVGTLCNLPAALLAPCAFKLLGAPDAVAREGLLYLRLCLLGNIPYMVLLTLSAVFRSFISPLRSLLLWIVVAMMAVAGSGLLLFGPIAALKNNVASLALSWLIASVVGVVLGLYLLAALRNKCIGADDQPPPLWHRIRKLSLIGLPVIVADLFWIISNLSLFKVFVQLPNPIAAQAAWSIALKIEETFAAMPLLAVSQAVAAIVGYNLGAAQGQRARKDAATVALMSAQIVCLIGTVIALAAPAVAAFFSEDPSVRLNTILLLELLPLTLPLLALWLIFFGALEGAGYTLKPTMWNLLGYMAVRVPVIWVLAVPAGLAVHGAAVGLVVSRLFLCFAAVNLFQRDAWLSPRTIPAAYR